VLPLNFLLFLDGHFIPRANGLTVARDTDNSVQSVRCLTCARAFAVSGVEDGDGEEVTFPFSALRPSPTKLIPTYSLFCVLCALSRLFISDDLTRFASLA